MIKSFIPLRSGSKSIPLKNIKPIAGKPLAQWVIDASNKSKYIEETTISIDKKEVFECLTDCQRFQRSEETATDTATSESALIEFCKQQNDDDIIVFLQATSPLITHKEIDEGIRSIVEDGYDSALSVVRQLRFIWNDDDTPSYDLNNRPRRQDWNGYLVENGAFYISKVEHILNSQCRLSGKIKTIECPEEMYYEIDELSDWIIVGNLLDNRETGEYN